jgi:hypothetical protein
MLAWCCASQPSLVVYDHSIHLPQILAHLGPDDRAVVSAACRRLAAALPRRHTTSAWSATSSHARFLWALEGGLPAELAIDAAIERGSVAMLRRLVSLGCSVSVKHIVAAARLGHWAVVEWSAEQHPWSEKPDDWDRILVGAAIGRHRSLCRRIHARAALSASALAHAAAEVGDATLLEAACNRGHRGNVDEVIGQHGDYELLLQARRLGLVADPWLLMHHAAEAGRTAFMQRLVDEGCPLPYDIASLALVEGRVDTAQWCIDRGFGFENPAVAAQAVESAVRGGHVVALEWLVDAHACEWWPRLAVLAAYAGHVAVLEWARTRDLELKPQAVLEAAASAGRVAVLDWVERQYALDRARLPLARGVHGGVRTVEWLLARGAELPVRATMPTRPSVARHIRQRWHETEPTPTHLIRRLTVAAADYLVSHRRASRGLLANVECDDARLKARFERCVGDARDTLVGRHRVSDALVGRIVASLPLKWRPMFRLVCPAFCVGGLGIVEGPCAVGAW